MDIYLLKYNNYYNRKYKREENLSAYLPFVVYQVAGVNTWVEGDGVENSWTSLIKELPSRPDYLICAEGATIKSRWFVTEINEISLKRYRFTLRRDLVAESVPQIMDSPMYIERCILPQSSPFIYNSENFAVNRIKKKETLIKDTTGVPWLIGYLNRSAETINIKTALDITPNITVNSLESWEYYQYINTDFNGSPADDWAKLALYFNYQYNKAQPGALVPAYTNYAYDITLEKTTLSRTYNTLLRRDGYSVNTSQYIPTAKQVENAFRSEPWVNEINTRLGMKSADATQALVNLDGQVLKAGNQYFKISIAGVVKVFSETINNAETEELRTIDRVCKEKLGGTVYKDDVPKYNVFTISTSGVAYRIKLSEMFPETELEVTLTGKDPQKPETNLRPHVSDAPYDIFALPYGTYRGMGSKELSLKIMTALLEQENVSQNSNIFDVQLLPFAPDFAEKKDEIKRNGSVVGYIYYADASSFSRTLSLTDPVEIIDKKIESICDLYRLVSPNYNGQFEFTAAKNGGISNIKIDCTYIPYQPYMRIAPLFGELYGEEFTDARGLICGGDFSIPVVNSAWTSFVQNNKNYANIFDRNIKHLEFQQEQQRIQEKWNIGTGIVSGAVSGAGMGAAAGPWGAVAGAVVGAAASGVGGALDTYYNELARKEQISLSKDVNRLQLQNIAAQPDSLARTSAFNATNKIFPILEYYTCTEDERVAVAKSIAINSMTAGFVSTLRKYAGMIWSYGNVVSKGFFSGRLILTEIEEDPHFLNALNAELMQGIFFEEAL